MIAIQKSERAEPAANQCFECVGDEHRQSDGPRPVEKQAALLLRALHSIYVALAAFACATLVTLLGAGLISAVPAIWLRVLAGLGIALGFVAVGGLVVGCVNLFHATHLSVLNIRDEADVIRTQQFQGRPGTSP